MWKNQIPKSKIEALIGAPSTWTWASGRCQPRGRMHSVAIAIVEGVRLLIGLEGEPPANRLAHRPVAGHDVRPGGGEGVLEVAHEHRGAAVQRVDHHLRLGRAGDLDAPVVEVRRRRGDAPIRVAALDRVRQEVRRLAGVEPRLPPRAVRQQSLALGIEGPMELRHEVERLGGQHLLEVRRVGRDHDAGREELHASIVAGGGAVAVTAA